MNDKLWLQLFAKKCVELSIMNKNLIKVLKQIKNIVDNSYTYEYEAIIDIKNIMRKEIKMGIISSAMLHSWEEMGCLDDDNSEELKTENIKLKEGNKQLLQTLQEIKAIAEENQFYFGEGTIVSYKTIKQLATNFEKILDLITKAESEG